MFLHVDAYPGDPILTLNEDFQKDPRADKINLSIGIYFDNDLMLNTCPHDKYDGWEDTSVTTKTAPPQVKTVGRLNCKTKIHYWLVKQGG